MEKGNWELWGVYSSPALEFEIGAGNPYVWERKDPERPHAQSFKGMCGNRYGKGGREAHVGLPLSEPDVQAAAL